MSARWAFLPEGEATKPMSYWRYALFASFGLLVAPWVSRREILKDLRAAIPPLLVALSLLLGPLVFWFLGPLVAWVKKRQHERAMDAANMRVWRAAYAAAHYWGDRELMAELEAKNPVATRKHDLRLRRVMQAQWFYRTLGLPLAAVLGYNIGTEVLRGEWWQPALNAVILGLNLWNVARLPAAVRDAKLAAHVS